MSFGLWTWMGRRNHVLDGVQRCWGTLPWQPILGLKLLLTGFMRMIATRQLVIEWGVWVVGWQNADIADTRHQRGVATATTFWLSMGYNFGCMIASDTLFDSGSGFSGQAIQWTHSQFRGSKGCCHGNHILAFYIWDALWRHLANTIESSMCGGDAALRQITLPTC